MKILMINITHTVKSHVYLLCLFPPARNQAFDVVLVDTAGRMQDNAPLMTALAKLIAVNMPDLVLFVGEALVGNEAVDQLVRERKRRKSMSLFTINENACFFQELSLSFPSRDSVKLLHHYIIHNHWPEFTLNQ